jgi:hypothetical protein
MSETRLTAESDARPAIEPLPGISLRRLLAITAITPGQAALLTRDIAEEITRRAPDGQHQAPLDMRTAWIGLDGRLRSLRQPSPPDAAPTDDAATALHIIRSLGREADASRPRSHDDSARPLIDLDDRPEDLTHTVARVHATATAVLGNEEDIARIRRELAALAHVAQGHVNGEHDRSRGAAERPTSGPHAEPPVTHPDWGSARRKAWHRARPRIRWKLIAGVVVIAAALAAGWVGLPRAWSELQAGWESLLGTEPPPRTLVPVPPVPDAGEAVNGETADAAEGDADPDPLEPPAPTSAGPINEISLDVEGADCAAGQRCLVRTEVGMEPAGATRTVAWTLEIVDRCSGDTTSAPGVTVTAQPGWSQVWGNSELELPDGPALAVYAVTTSPADAASPALLVPADGSC